MTQSYHLSLSRSEKVSQQTTELIPPSTYFEWPSLASCPRRVTRNCNSHVRAGNPTLHRTRSNPKNKGKQKKTARKMQNALEKTSRASWSLQGLFRPDFNRQNLHGHISRFLNPCGLYPRNAPFILHLTFPSSLSLTFPTLTIIFPFFNHDACFQDKRGNIMTPSSCSQLSKDV